MSIAVSSPTCDAPLAASVIIPHHDQKESLVLCIRSVIAQSARADDFEIIVADNRTPGGVLDVKREFPGVRFVDAHDMGAAHARNAAMAVARGRAFAFIDADCIADPHWLATGLAALDDAELVGGEVKVFVNDPARPTPVESFERVFAFNQRAYIARKRFSVTANLFARADAARRIGNFRNGVAEDVDWCRRAAKLGFRLAFNDKSIVAHPARRDFEALTQKWERLVRERWRGLEQERFARRLRWALLACATALSPAPHLLAVVASSRLETARQKIDATIVLIRIRWWRARRMAAMLALALEGDRQ